MADSSCLVRHPIFGAVSTERRWCSHYLEARLLLARVTINIRCKSILRPKPPPLYHLVSRDFTAKLSLLTFVRSREPPWAVNSSHGLRQASCPVPARALAQPYSQTGNVAGDIAYRQMQKTSRSFRGWILRSSQLPKQQHQKS